MPSHLGDESPRVTNVIEVVDEDVEVLLLGIKWLTQRLAPIFSLGLKDEWMECGEDERSSFLKNEVLFQS
jgi:hypothetical protein